MKIITPKELKQLMESNPSVKIVEVLAKEKYEEGHIPGAMNIPYDVFSEEAPKVLEKDETIVLYCSDTMCTASTKRVEELEELGYQDVYDLEVGKKGWMEEGFKLEK